jgi:hypothetical protein
MYTVNLSALVENSNIYVTFLHGLKHYFRQTPVLRAWDEITNDQLV